MEPIQQPNQDNGPRIVASLLRSLCPTGTAVATAAIGEQTEPLFPVEEAAISRAVAKRRGEFATGRLCARRVLDELGVGRPAIPVGPDRAPVWPPGIVGSITHCGDLAAAAALRIGAIMAIGIDAEPAGSLPGDVRHMVLRPRETDSLDTEEAPFDAGTVIFSAKEAIHKCINPSTGIMLDFLDVEVVLDSGGEFRATLVGDFPELTATFERLVGRYTVAPTHVLAVATLAGT